MTLQLVENYNIQNNQLYLNEETTIQQLQCINK